MMKTSDGLSSSFGQSSTWWEFTPGECLLWLKILWGGKYLKRCWRANQEYPIKVHADQHLCNYRRFSALTDCTLYPSYVTKYKNCTQTSHLDFIQTLNTAFGTSFQYFVKNQLLKTLFFTSLPRKICNKTATCYPKKKLIITTT